ncbi:hypothetical protein LL912_19545 [Niabella sp. CC-SYL272]|uniref:hypothetical protein n=1 Tax=Niabella agricola TaxID=2891571 RepID=UPI001F2932B3|nr:hypothetical protein [Niabella agricola]MCF3110990.1 hypothetical protein [Niabella agricola]
MDNAVATPAPNTNPHFNEAQWLQVLFLLADTQCWLQQSQEQLIWQLPVKNRKKLLRKNWYLSAKALAHILERHYYKVPRHPLASKFTLSIPAIAAAIRDAYQQPPAPVPDSELLQRVWDTGAPVGYDTTGRVVNILTVITDAAGEIITAFPGIIDL